MATTAQMAMIDPLARAQRGHVARWQLLALGWPPGTIDRMVSGLGLTVVHAGVWRLPGVEPTPQGGMWAALLAAMTLVQRNVSGPPVQSWEAVHQRVIGRIAVTGFSAAWLLGLATNPPTNAQLLLPHHVQRRISSIRIVRTRVWPEELTDLDDMPLTDAVRTLWVCGWLMRHDPSAVGRMRRMMSRADGLRLCRAPDLHLRAREPRAYGLPDRVPEPFRAAAFSLAGGHSHSGAEHRGRRIVTELAAVLGLQVEPRPYPVLDGGRVVGEADIAIPAIRFDCEIDGPHHDQPDQQAKDRRRDARMRRVDWTVRRYPVWLLDEDEQAFRQAVDADIRQTAAAVGVPLRDA